MPPPRPLDPPIPALHPERDALLAAVRDADPADDLPALVYADWQDEHGQPEHAELIRVMVELPKTRKQDAASKERRSKLLARMKELFKTPPLAPVRKLGSNTYNFRRGFIRDLTLTATGVRMVYSPADREKVSVPALAGLPAFVPFDKLAWIGLRLYSTLNASEAAAIAAVPWLVRVDRLEIHCWPVVPLRTGRITPLVASKLLGGLRAFHTVGRIAGSVWAAVCLAKSATRLQQIGLANAQRGVTPDSSVTPRRHAFLSVVEQIVSSKRARQFTSFGDDIVDVDEALAKILLASKHLGGIRTFAYDFAKITAKTRAAFIERFGPAVEA